MTKIECFGKIAYEAYCNQTGNKSLVTGCELPTWEQLKETIQFAWISAAEAVLDASLEGI